MGLAVSIRRTQALAGEGVPRERRCAVGPGPAGRGDGADGTRRGSSSLPSRGLALQLTFTGRDRDAQIHLHVAKGQCQGGHYG